MNISIRIIVVIASLMMSTTSFSQMAAARKIPPKFVAGVTLKSSPEEVWKTVSEPSSYSSFVKSISNFKCSGIGTGAKMSFSIPGDSKREQNFSSIDKDNRVIAIYITKSDYYHQAFVYRMSVTTDQDGTYIRFEAIYSTDKKTEAKINAAVKKEWALIKAGLQSKFIK